MLTSVKDLASRCRNIENALRQLNASYPRKDDNSTSANSKKRIGTSGSSFGSSAPTKTKARTGTSALDITKLSDRFKNLKPLTEAKRDRCVKEALCLRCREPGHRLFEKDKY